MESCIKRVLGDLGTNLKTGLQFCFQSAAFTLCGRESTVFIRASGVRYPHNRNKKEMRCSVFFNIAHTVPLRVLRLIPPTEVRRAN